MMKRILSILIAAFLIIGLAACENNTVPAAPESSAVSGSSQTSDHNETSAASAPETSAPPESEEAPESAEDMPETESTQTGTGVLVVVFSATGTTKGVAEMIAAIENADLYEITAAQEYTSDDLNWHDSSSRTTLEQNDKNARPEIGSEPISLEGYSVIYIGFPIWWGEEPRIMDTFVESYDFEDITMIPFCTSSSSGIGRSGQNLAENAGSGNWLEGQRFSGSVSEDELRSWIEELQS